ALVGSRVRAEGDVHLSAGRDTTIEAAMNESHSAYLVRSRGSSKGVVRSLGVAAAVGDAWGRKGSKSGQAFASQSVASVIESGGSIQINSEIYAAGALQLTGGRDLRIDGSRLAAEQDISLAALRDIDVTSVLEQQSSLAQRSKSSLLGKSSSSESRSSTQQ